MSEDTKDAATVMDGTLSLVRALLLRHETLVIAEFREVIEAKNHELKLIYQQRDEEHGKAQSQAAENTALKKEIAALEAKLRWCYDTSMFRFVTPIITYQNWLDMIQMLEDKP